MGFSMIPLTTLYDEYIDRVKLPEQKTINPVDYIVPPASRGGGTNTRTREMCQLLLKDMSIVSIIWVKSPKNANERIVI